MPGKRHSTILYTGKADSSNLHTTWNRQHKLIYKAEQTAQTYKLYTRQNRQHKLMCQVKQTAQT